MDLDEMQLEEALGSLLRTRTPGDIAILLARLPGVSGPNVDRLLAAAVARRELFRTQAGSTLESSPKNLGEDREPGWSARISSSTAR